ncbi:MAG: class II aldolase/adducin family protein [Thermoleophilia bacterium]|nr:class II aldolase/adducin family protein [Thermoleophilia bacterium]
MQSLAEQVASACRILALEGYTDLTLGHVSARAPDSTAVRIKRRGVALDEVEAADVIPLDLESGDGFDSPEMHLEAVLHTEVYRARPDVGAVVHGHPPHATALSASREPLELLTHDAVLFAGGLGVFEETPELITGRAMGEAVARALGSRRGVLLRNHGVLVVGKTVAWAVLTAVTLERAARLQAIAAALGPLAPMSRATAERMLPEKYNDSLVDEYWAAWLRRLRRAGAGPEA